jgi:predicted RNA binding protein YcfA (HicA-like mRNA interferase family)
MPRLPRISGKEIIKRLERAGYYQTRQKGSHVWLAHEKRPPTTIPLHEIVGPGLLRQILREIKMSPEEFSNL